MKTGMLMEMPDPKNTAEIDPECPSMYTQKDYSNLD